MQGERNKPQHTMLILWAPKRAPTFWKQTCVCVGAPRLFRVRSDLRPTSEETTADINNCGSQEGTRETGLQAWVGKHSVVNRLSPIVPNCTCSWYRIRNNTSFRNVPAQAKAGCLGQALPIPA